MRKLQKNFIAIIIMGIFLAAVLISVVSAFSFQNVVERDSSKILDLTCDSNADDLNNIFLKTEELVETIASHYRNELKSVAALKDPQYLVDYTSSMQDLAYNIAANNKDVVAIYYRFAPDLAGPTSGFFISKSADSDNPVAYTPTDLSAFDSSDVEHVGWYYAPMETGKAVWMEPYQNENNGIYMISYVTPLIQSGTVVGVVGIDINFETVCDRVSEIATYDSGYAILVNGEGEIVFSGDHEPGINQECLDKLLASDEQNATASYTERQKLIRVNSQKLENNMYMMLLVPDEEVNLDRNRMIFTVILFAVIISTILVTVSSGMLQRIFRQSKQDEMTKAENTASYYERQANLYDFIERGKSGAFSVIVFDINSLKRVNDRLGHASGDALIRDGYEAIRNAFPRETIYRIGGDEFCLISEKIMPETLRIKLDTFQKEMDQAGEGYDPDTLKAIVSAGMATFDASTDHSFSDVFKRADREMYQTKAEFYKKNNHLDRRT